MRQLIHKAAAVKRRLLFMKKLASIPRHANNDRTTLAIVTGELEVGGVGRVLLNIVTALPRKDYEIFIFTTDPRHNAWAPEFAKHVDHIIDIPPTIGRKMPDVYVRRYLESYLAKNRADIIFITNSAAAYNALPAIRTHGLSKDAAIYDLLHTHGRPEDDDAFLKTSMPFDAHIDKRIVISQYLKSYFCQHYPISPDKVMVIYNGIDDTTATRVANPAHGRAFLGLSDGEQAISYLGRLQSDKSPHRLVELGALLKSELDAHSTFIAIVGEGELEASLRDRATELGVLGKQVRFYPFTNAPMDVCAASLCTLITSDLEGIPMVALESMQVGVPVVAPAVGGLPEIVSDNHEGFVASFDGLDETQKVAALVSAVKRMLQLNSRARHQMGNRAKQKVKTTFSSMGEKYLQLFTSAHNSQITGDN